MSNNSNVATPSVTPNGDRSRSAQGMASVTHLRLSINSRTEGAATPFTQLGRDVGLHNGETLSTATLPTLSNRPLSNRPQSNCPTENLALFSLPGAHSGTSPEQVVNVANHAVARAVEFNPTPSSQYGIRMTTPAKRCEVPELDVAWIRVASSADGMPARRGRYGSVSTNATLRLPPVLSPSHPFHAAWEMLKADLTLEGDARTLLSSGYGCAVKEMRDSDSNADRLFGLKHPNLVRAYGWCKCPDKDGYVWLIMERGDSDLRSAMADVLTLLPFERWKVARDVASAIASLGASGVVHRDIKPENIIRCGHTWKLGDFGLARYSFSQRYNDSAELVERDSGGGTPNWTDPKCLNTEACLEYHGLPLGLQAQIDVYSLGKLVEYLFPSNTVARAIHDACCAPQLYLRCVSWELLRDGLFDELECNAPEGDWRDAHIRQGVELRLRLMHYYHQRYHNQISLSRPELPFRAVFQQMQLSEDGNVNERPTPLTIAALLQKPAIREARVVMLRGNPGSGKTVLTRYLGREQTEATKAGFAPFAAVVVVPLSVLAYFDDNAGRSATSLARWCLQPTDESSLTGTPNNAFVDATVSLLEAVGWDKVLWVLDGYDEVQSSMQPFINRHVRRSTFHIPSFMRRVLLTSRYSTDAVGADATVHLLPWSEADIVGYLTAVQNVTTVRRERVPLQTIRNISGRAASDLTPRLVDLTVFAVSQNQGATPPNFAEIVMKVCESLMRRAPGAARLRHCVDEVSQHSEDFLVSGEIKESASHSLSRNPIVVKARRVNEAVVYELHHRTIGEVLFAWNLLRSPPDDLPHQLVRVLSLDARLRVDPTALGADLGGLMSTAIDSSEWSITQKPAHLVQCIDCVLNSSTARRLIAANVRADFVVFLVHGLTPDTAEHIHCVAEVTRMACTSESGLLLLLAAACGRADNATLLSAIYDDLGPSSAAPAAKKKEALLQCALANLQPSRGKAVLQFCAAKGLLPALWMCLLHLSPSALLERLDSHSPIDDDYVLQVWAAFLYIEARCHNGCRQVICQWLSRHCPADARETLRLELANGFPRDGGQAVVGALKRYSDRSQFRYRLLLERLKATFIATWFLDWSQRQVDDALMCALADALRESAVVPCVNLSSNEIGADGAAALATTLRTNATLTRVDLSSNHIGPAGASALADALRTNSTLTSIGLNANQIGVGGAFALAETLREATRVTSLSLSSNQIGDAGAEALAEALRVNRTLISVDLAANRIGNDGAFALVDALRVNATLTSVNLSNNQIGDVGAEALADALRVNPKLTSVDLGVNLLGDAGADALSGALKVNEKVTSLRLNSNQIGFGGAFALATALRVNTTLFSVNLNSNPIGDAGAEALAGSLSVNAKVTSVDLSFGRIGDAGAKALAGALEVNRTVTSVDLSQSRIGDAGAKALASALKANTIVSRIDLSTSQIGDAGAAALADALKDNATLTSVNLSSNQIGDAGAKALADALRTNTTVTCVDLSLNAIGDPGAEALGRALSVRSTVICLDSHSNQISDAGTSALAEALRVNKSRNGTARDNKGKWAGCLLS